jgi:hypothetical protein
MSAAFVQMKRSRARLNPSLEETSDATLQTREWSRSADSYTAKLPMRKRKEPRVHHPNIVDAKTPTRAGTIGYETRC